MVIFSEKGAKSMEQIGESAHLIDGNMGRNGLDGTLERGRDSLAEDLREGSPAAATKLVDKYYEQIYRYMRRLGHGRQTSEDLTQESFLRAWQHTEQLRNGRALNGWLYRIAGNVSRLYWRRGKGKGAVSIEGFELSQTDDGQVEQAEQDEQLERLNKAIGELPLKLKEAIILHYMQQLTISEAAQAQGVREGTCKSRLNRALERLRKQLG